MHIRVYMKCAMGDAANLLYVLHSAKAIHDLVRTGETINFTLRSPLGLQQLHLDTLWANHVTVALRQHNFNYEVVNDY